MYPSPELWDDQTALALYYRQHAISLVANPGVVVASIIVSLLGSYATLTLLGRRTGSHGWRNHFILGLSVICFATVAVWGMHFVSFQGFVLQPAPQHQWYLEFSPGFTAMSLFVPLVACWLAFYFLGDQDELHIWRIGVAGISCGGMIGLMHYSASFQQPLYIVSYKAYTIVLAILIAMIATTVAFFTFFRLRAHWQDNFIKRSACALVLAIAVCGMHYVGLWGTSFSVKSNTDPADLSAGKKKIIRITIAVSVMCGVIVLISIGFAVWDYISDRDIRSKARKIVIASAAFDRQGRLLVRPDGHLPMHVIESQADLKDVLEELDPRQQTFQWLYSLSFNWKILNPFIPRIRNTIARRHATVNSKKKGNQTKAGKTEELVQFRSRFIEAAYELAEELELSLENIGTMFDRVLTTGTRKAQAEHEKDLALGKRISRDDESSIHGITLNLPNSEGVMLFVVRELADPKNLSAIDLPPGSEKHMSEQFHQDNVEKYLSKGYRMADVKFFSGILAERIGVGKTEMDTYLNALKTYAKRGCKPVVQAGGVYLGLYGVRPSSSRQAGVDVLVYNFARHQIPAYRLPEVSYPVSTMMKSWIREISNMTLFEVLQNANNAIARAEADETRDSDRETQNSEAEELLDFQTALAIAAEALGQAMRTWPNLYAIARLSPEILDMPSSINDTTTPAQMIVLEAVLPSPMQALTPSVSRASVSKGEVRPSVSDKPPQPFVFTPYCLFAIAQAQILQGKTSHNWSKEVTAQLAKLYSSAPTDVLAELDEAENPNAVDPFTNGNRLTTLMDHPNFPHHKRTGTTRSKPLPGLSLLDRNRRGSNAASLTSANYHEDEMEKGNVSSVLGHNQDPGYTVDYPPTSPSSGGLKRFLGGKGSESSPVGLGHTGTNALISPAPAYTTAVGEQDDFAGNVNPARAGTDGWHARAMRQLERTEQGGSLLGCQW